MECTDKHEIILQRLPTLRTGTSRRTLTIAKPGLSLELRRSAAGADIIESIDSTLRQVCRNV